MNKRKRIKRWIAILLGLSVDHVKQPIGHFFIANSISGYFNDLTKKVLRQKKLLKTNDLPVVKDDNGEDVVFPVAIIQYGLGAYDLYLKTKKEIYKKKFFECANWVLNNTAQNGSIDNFSCFNMAPFGAMCQGEAISLLARAYVQTNDRRYIECSSKLYSFLMTPIDNGGVASYKDNLIVLFECTDHSPILNGWIFALFGIYDFYLLSNDKSVKDVLDQSVYSLSQSLPLFDNKTWSLYDLDGNIASPFYHKLHIAQLEALTKISDDKFFLDYYKIFKKRKNNPFCYLISVIKKAFQQIRK